MDVETISAVAFMLFGLGFFVVVIHMTWKHLFNHKEQAHSQKVHEAREFGYEGSRLQARALKLKPKTK